MAAAVAVLGTGLLGAGFVRGFLKRNHPVHCWNRSASKAQVNASRLRVLHTLTLLYRLLKFTVRRHSLRLPTPCEVSSMSTSWWPPMPLWRRC